MHVLPSQQLKPVVFSLGDFFLNLLDTSWDVQHGVIMLSIIFFFET
jgi:hypothetical protein